MVSDSCTKAIAEEEVPLVQFQDLTVSYGLVRALAGVSGNEQARIFCRDLGAELVLVDLLVFAVPSAALFLVVPCVSPFSSADAVTAPNTSPRARPQSRPLRWAAVGPQSPEPGEHVDRLAVQHGRPEAAPHAASVLRAMSGRPGVRLALARRTSAASADRRTP